MRRERHVGSLSQRADQRYGEGATLWHSGSCQAPVTVSTVAEAAEYVTRTQSPAASRARFRLVAQDAEPQKPVAAGSPTQNVDALLIVTIPSCWWCGAAHPVRAPTPMARTAHPTAPDNLARDLGDKFATAMLTPWSVR